MKAKPAALVVACCSAIPTSNARFGNFSANLSKPVGPSIAAVIATISSRLAPISQISSEKTLVQLGADLATGTPVSGFTTPTAWNFSAESFIAGAWPRPFSVIT